MGSVTDVVTSKWKWFAGGLVAFLFLRSGSASADTSANGNAVTPSVSDLARLVPAYAAEIVAASAATGMPASIIAGTIRRESNWQLGILGDGGKAHSLMQINTQFHADYDTSRDMDAGYNIMYGARLLRQLYDWATKYASGDMALLLALYAYNRGQTAALAAYQATGNPGGDVPNSVTYQNPDYGTSILYTYAPQYQV